MEKIGLIFCHMSTAKRKSILLATGGMTTQTSPSILANKKGQPITNCNRRFLGGFINRIVLCTTYQKSRRIEMEQGGKNLIFIWGPNAQHENEATGKFPPYRVINHIVRPRRVIFCLKYL